MRFWIDGGFIVDGAVEVVGDVALQGFLVVIAGKGKDGFSGYSGVNGEDTAPRFGTDQKLLGFRDLRGVTVFAAVIFYPVAAVSTRIAICSKGRHVGSVSDFGVSDGSAAVIERCLFDSAGAFIIFTFTSTAGEAFVC